ncbi:unnamed protein product [Trifolium pratense]|uniref:Uncharacterized protein n=1 Tax=Trifolium pratense TaxID=57577 RepID=A0ACB0M085_TRIPR|nr:unnamed protein product [Trifolium pratense]
MIKKNFTQTVWAKNTDIYKRHLRVASLFPFGMEGGENILDAIYEENDDDNLDDVEMLDVEEGELVEDNHQNGVVAQHHNLTDTNNTNNQKPKPNRKRKSKKRKKKGLGSDSIDINRFVIETCRRLKEKKSYMVYTAVGCLGVSALSDLVKEVDAIQSCGGQMTADGKRFRSGGGVLWNIIKVREPNAYKEIMKKAREFEKQFRQPCFHQPPMPKKEKDDSSQGVPCIFSSGSQSNVSDNPSCAAQMEDQPKPLGSEEKRVSVHDRLRVPVSYDDDLLGASVDNDANLVP